MAEEEEVDYDTVNIEGNLIFGNILALKDSRAGRDQNHGGLD